MRSLALYLLAWWYDSLFAHELRPWSLSINSASVLWFEVCIINYHTHLLWKIHQVRRFVLIIFCNNSGLAMLHRKQPRCGVSISASRSRIWWHRGSTNFDKLIILYVLNTRYIGKRWIEKRGMNANEEYKNREWKHIVEVWWILIEWEKAVAWSVDNPGCLESVYLVTCSVCLP